jgi:hypothetical protein
MLEGHTTSLIIEWVTALVDAVVTAGVGVLLVHVVSKEN